MSPYTPFRSRRWIHHFLPIRVLENIWFFFVKSSWGMKIVITGVVCIFSGLFFPWIQIGDMTYRGPFSLLCWGIGWWISILMMAILIHLFSYDMSQKIQKSWHINLDPKILFVRVGNIIVIMTLIVSISLTGAARTVNQDINMIVNVSGLVFTLMGGILLILWGIVVRRKEEKDAYKHVFVQGVENEDTDSYKKILGETEEWNMKLPI
jgi:hypothetical protein